MNGFNEHKYMRLNMVESYGGSENGSTPKSSTIIGGLSIINHQFWGSPIYRTPPYDMLPYDPRIWILRQQLRGTAWHQDFFMFCFTFYWLAKAYRTIKNTHLFYVECIIIAEKNVTTANLFFKCVPHSNEKLSFVLLEKRQNKMSYIRSFLHISPPFPRPNLDTVNHPWTHLWKTWSN